MRCGILAALAARVVAQRREVVLHDVHQATRIRVALAQCVDDAGAAGRADDQAQYQEGDSAHARTLGKFSAQA